MSVVKTGKARPAYVVTKSGKTIRVCLNCGNRAPDNSAYCRACLRASRGRP